MDLFGIPALHESLRFDPHYIEAIRRTILALDLPVVPETGSIFLWRDGRSWIDDQQFGPIIDCVLHAFHSLIRRRYPAERAQRIIGKMGSLNCASTEMWAMRGGAGYFQPPHIHRDGALSAVFYIDAGDAETKLIFLSPNPIDHTEGLGERDISVKSGDLILFPSWVMHFVTQYEGTRPRLLLTFNTSIDTLTGSQPRV